MFFKTILFLAVNIAQVCSDQLFNVINDVLEHSKLEESKITLEYAPMSLYQIVEDSLQVCGLFFFLSFTKKIADT